MLLSNINHGHENELGVDVSDIMYATCSWAYTHAHHLTTPTRGPDIFSFMYQPLDLQFTGDVEVNSAARHQRLLQPQNPSQPQFFMPA